MPSYKEIEKMSQMMDKMGLSEMKIETSALWGVIREEIHLSKKQNAATATTPASNEVHVQKPEVVASEQEKTESDKKAVNFTGALRSPMVGVAYLSPEPGSKTFTTVGTAVKAGDTLALIEAMKTFNPVKADKDGIVKEILVADGQAVEFDQPLIIIE
ncbi:MAG: acetyl-CoA carboxylase biotin carboxyl carrier protein [Alphaproteobacteria bacterium]|nr:acetyl-CoA carboxylase biotin carboxyl carrier protein [Alphaproteobacteria bacterium]